MTEREAVELLTPCRLDREHPSTWIDLGCGSGLFTYALAALLAPESRIYAVDKQPGFVRKNGGNVLVEVLRSDFIHDQLPFADVDGIQMANSLHYVKDKSAFIRKMKRHLHAASRWVIIEYDTRKANPWVPYPVDFDNLQQLFGREGYQQVVKRSKRPSLYNAENMYCATVQQ